MAESPTTIEMMPAPGDDPAPTPKETPTKPPVDPSNATTGNEFSDSVFLKQEGKVYLVKDWATLQRWIMERRVSRDDLVSEGGIRWDTIGSRPELGSFFTAIERLENLESEDEDDGHTSEQSQASDPPPSSLSRGLSRLDDETEGIPTGLPPLPTEEVERLAIASLVEVPEPEAHRPMLQEAPIVLEMGDEESPADPPQEPSHPSSDEEVIFPDFGHIEEKPSLSEVETLSFEPEFEGEALPTEDVATNHLSGNEDFDEFGSFGDLGEDSLADAQDESNADTIETKEEVSADAPTELEFGVSLDESFDIDDLSPSAQSFDDSFGDTTFEAEDSFFAENSPPEADSDPFEEFGDFYANASSAEAPRTPLQRNPAVIAGVLAVITVVVLLLLVYQNPFSSPADDSVVTEESLPPEPDETTTTANDGTEAEPQTPPDGEENSEEGTEVEEDVGDESTETDEANQETSEETEEPSPTETTPSEPSPKPVNPAPTVTPPTGEPGTVDLSSLDEKAWKAIDRGNAREAIGLFNTMLESAPNHSGALYGYGYALLQQGKRTEAQKHLCRALETAGDDQSILRDVNGLLKNNSLSCS